jgi:hypothetical protein
MIKTTLITIQNEIDADPNYNSSGNEDLTKDICLD